MEEGGVIGGEIDCINTNFANDEDLRQVSRLMSVLNLLNECINTNQDSVSSFPSSHLSNRNPLEVKTTLGPKLKKYRYLLIYTNL